MKKVDIYRVEYKAMFPKIEGGIIVSLTDWVVGKRDVLAAVEKGWYKDAVQVLPNTLSLFFYMSDVYFDESADKNNLLVYEVVAKKIGKLGYPWTVKELFYVLTDSPSRIFTDPELKETITALPPDEFYVVNVKLASVKML